VRLLCDEMLAGLGRWLRAAGYDTEIVMPRTADRLVRRRAIETRRRLLTRDRALARVVPGAVLLTADGLDAAASEAAALAGIDWLHAPLTRCLLDNAALVPASPEQRARVPANMRGPECEVRACPVCERVYWPGRHVQRMLARLAGWRESAESCVRGRGG
jgi:uncharacterized protein with PIN domain